MEAQEGLINDCEKLKNVEITTWETSKYQGHIQEEKLFKHIKICSRICSSNF